MNKKLKLIILQEMKKSVKSKINSNDNDYVFLCIEYLTARRNNELGKDDLILELPELLNVLFEYGYTQEQLIGRSALHIHELGPDCRVLPSDSIEIKKKYNLIKLEIIDKTIKIIKNVKRKTCTNHSS